MLAHSILACARSSAVDAIVVVVQDGANDRARRMSVEIGVALRDVVVGGPSRQESVRLGLEAVDAADAVVLCHDAARPFATPGLFDRAVAALAGRPDARGVVPVVPVSDTVKRVRHSAVLETLPREELVLAQTPQAFDAPTLREAHDRAAGTAGGATDDAALVEAAGHVVLTIAGELGNFKITTREDLVRAERLLSIPATDEMVT